MKTNIHRLKLSKLSLCMLVGLLLTACRASKFDLSCVYKPIGQNVISNDPFENVSIDIGVDASGSMEGFVGRSGTLYIQAIDSLSTLIGNRNIDTRYWRVGSAPAQNVNEAQIITATQFLEAKSPKFYNCRAADSNYPCVSSTLHQIYELPNDDDFRTAVSTSEDITSEQDLAETADASGLGSQTPQVVKILVTDLEPNQSAITQLSSRVSRELADNPDYKAVLVGIRSQFNGNVFSAETGQVVVVNHVVDTPEVDQLGRPFYFVMTGPERSLDAIIENFANLPLDVSRSFRVTSFASSDIDTIILDKSSISDPVSECLIQRGTIGRQRPLKEQEDQWLMVEQRGCKGETETVMNIWSETSKSLLGAQITPDQLISSNPNIEVTEVEVENNRLKVQVSVPLNRTFRSGAAVYLTLAQQDLDNAVWNNWNSTTDQADDDRIRGAKTQNLLLFVSGLRQAVKGMASKKPVNTEPLPVSEPSGDALKFCIGFS